MKDSKRKPNGYWTKENCKKEALKYKTRSKFYKGSVSAYNSSLRNGWLDVVCGHMLTRSEVTTKWTYERCSQESLRYETRGEFRKGSSSAYYSSLRNGWLGEICEHMIEIIKPKGHWTKENCRKEALKYKTRTEFQKESKGAYNSSRRNGWLDEICKDMEVVGNLKMRGIYVFEFEDNSAYVGLTGNFKKRYNKHMNSIKSSVYKHIEETNLTPKFIQLTDYMDEELASKEETMWENKYITNGWNILNIRKTGGLGGSPKWDYDSCRKEALKYKTITEFRKGSSGAHGSSRRNGWLDDIRGHMIKIKKHSNHWTKENCRKEALKYKTRTEFQKGSSGAYYSSRRNGWLGEIFPKTEKV
jgi:predicted GIY-YIG superfamily endonuclease